MCAKAKLLIAIAASMILVLITGAPAFAAPHENPDEVTAIFSGISLFRYYSESLDSILLKNPQAAQNNLEKMPFAFIPQELEQATENFVNSSISVGYLVEDIDINLSKLKILGEESRLDEFRVLAITISENLSRAQRGLVQMEESITITGEYLNIKSLSLDSGLRQAYDDVLDKINKIRQMLLLDEELLKSEMNVDYRSLLQTNLTLEISPGSAFVGDIIIYKGILTSADGPLGGRKIEILLNGVRDFTVETDSAGRYSGTLQVPYRYASAMQLQALYYPRNDDTGRYIASLSPVLNLKVQYYQAKLAVGVNQTAYPGLETIVTGKLDYGQFPSAQQRNIEFYFDNTLTDEILAGDNFSYQLKVEPDVVLGKHTVTVSVAADGRHAPVLGNAIINVAKAYPVLRLQIPKLSLAPGNIRLNGKLYSELGPLRGATVRISLGKSKTELKTDDEGVFTGTLKAGIGFGIFGNQDLLVNTFSKEPWQGNLSTKRNIFVINIVSTTVTLLLLVVLIIYLPGILRRRLGVYLGKRTKREAVPESRQPVVIQAEVKPSNAIKIEIVDSPGEPKSRIIFFYRIVARLVQALTNAILKPQQTLREFAREIKGIPEPVSRQFMELTNIVETVLYSNNKATEEDASKTQLISSQIEKELKQ